MRCNLRRQPYARVHCGSSGPKSVSARWLPTRRPSCNIDLGVVCRLLQAEHSPIAKYYYSTTEGGRPSRPRHCSKCEALAQSCVSQWFLWKHKLLYAARFEPKISSAAVKHATTRPLLPAISSGRLWATLITLSRERFFDFKSCCSLEPHYMRTSWRYPPVVQGRPSRSS